MAEVAAPAPEAYPAPYLPTSSPKQTADGELDSKAVKHSLGQTASAVPGGSGLLPQAGVAGGMQPQYLPATAAAGQAGMMMVGPDGSALPMVAPGGLGMMPGGYGAAPQQLQALQPGAGAPYVGANGLGALPGLPGMDLGVGGAGGYGGGVSASLSVGYTADDGGGSGPEGGGGRSGRCKTVKQQEANKVAQQRYRERKKARFQEMEAQVEVLSKQLAALQALQSRNQILEVRC